MNHGYILHEINHRINEIYKTRAQINLEESAAQTTETTTETAPSHGLLHRIVNGLHGMLPLPGRVSSRNAIP